MDEVVNEVNRDRDIETPTYDLCPDCGEDELLVTYEERAENRKEYIAECLACGSTYSV